MSTMEAEYIALSAALRDLVPMRELICEVAAALSLNEAMKCRTYSKVFEDNNGCLILATSPKLMPRSKHIAVKYHWFREHVRKGKIHIIKVATDKQKADIFTKGLPTETFYNIRKLLMGW